MFYVFEKKMITRLVRIPTDFNPKMNDDIISIFLIGPILYSGFGYWMYSVPALMSNDVQPINHISSKNDTQHRIIDAFTKITPGTPFIFLFIIAVLAKIDHHTKIYKTYFESRKLQEKYQVLKDKNLNQDPDFYDALS